MFKLQAVFVLCMYTHTFTLNHSGRDLSQNTVGIAYLNTMCGSASVGVVQDGSRSTRSTGSTFAHELGHLFNLQHDTSKNMIITLESCKYLQCIHVHIRSISSLEWYVCHYLTTTTHLQAVAVVMTGLVDV